MRMILIVWFLYNIQCLVEWFRFYFFFCFVKKIELSTSLPNTMTPSCLCVVQTLHMLYARNGICICIFKPARNLLFDSVCRQFDRICSL